MKDMNNSIAVKTSNEDFNDCFDYSMLVYVPVGFLFLFSPVLIRNLKRSKRLPLMWTWRFALRQLITLHLMFVSAVLFIYNVSQGTTNSLPVNSYLYPLILTISMGYIFCLTLACRRHGLVSSGVIYFTFFAFVLFGLTEFRTHILKHNSGDRSNRIRFGLNVLFYPFVVVQFLLLSHADEPDPRTDQGKRNPDPEEKASFLNTLTFAYYFPMAYTGYKRALTMDDMWSLKDDNCSRVLVEKFDKLWAPLFKKYNKHKRAALDKLSDHQKYQYSFSNTSESEALIEPENLSKVPSEPSIVWVFAWCFKYQLILALIFRLTSDCIQFINPHLLMHLISFVENPEEPAWRGYAYSIGLLASQLAQAFFLQHSFYQSFTTAMHLKSVLVSSLFAKSLRLSNECKRNSTVGQIVNLMSMDVPKIMELMSPMNMLLSGPVQIILSIYFLSQKIGAAVIAGVTVMIILLPLNGFLANRLKLTQRAQMKMKDERLKIITEMLNSIKVLKLYAWETYFETKILSIREKELKAIKKVAYLRALFTSIWLCAPFLVSAASFAAYVLSDPENNIITAQVAFVSLSLFNILRIPMTMLSNLITLTVQAYVSNKRIRQFLLLDEIDPNMVLNLPYNEYDNMPAVEIENGEFSWEKDSPTTLHDINLTVPKKSLIAVVGQVGAGKSSLLSALLGDMEKGHGTVTIRGSIAYVPQQAWIQNSRLRDNIMFSKQYEEARYNLVIESCALKPDFDILPAGDSTEIGEKGLNLSGGQKQRVSLARALYQDSDIYIMDDPLSAVDSHVGKHIFDKVIGKEGLLKNKTRILVTHGIEFLRSVDIIVVMKDGGISEVGSYDDLVRDKKAFSEFLDVYQKQVGDGASEDLSAADTELGYGQAGMEGLSHQRSQFGKTDVSLGLGEKIETPNVQSNKTIILKWSKIKLDKYGSIRTIMNTLTSTNDLSHGIISEELEVLDNNDGNTKESNVEPKAPLAGENIMEAEHAATGAVETSVYGAYISALGYRCTLLVFMAYAVSNSFTVGRDVWLSAWSTDNEEIQHQLNYTTLDTVSSTKHTVVSNEGRLGGYAGLGLAHGFAVLVASSMTAYFSMKASRTLHAGLLRNIIRSPLKFFDVTPVGRIVNRLGNDVDSLDNTVPAAMPALINAVFSAFSNLLVVVFVTPILIAFIVPLAIFYFIVQRVFVSSSRQQKRLESVSRSTIYSHFHETIQGINSIRAYKAQKRFILESERRVDYNNMAYWANTISNRWLCIHLAVMGSCITFLSSLSAVLGRSSISGGLVGLSLTSAMSITSTLGIAVRMFSDVETNIVSVERIKEYSETPKEADWISSSPPPVCWPNFGNISLIDYQMRYRPGLDLVLRNINCHFKPKEKIGIVGRTGAGKSSLTLALFRIVEAAGGRITIDGFDIASIGLHELRSKLTIIPQDPCLFTGTIRLNLDPFNSYSDFQLWEVLMLSHLKNFVSSLPKKLEYEISEGGANLSVGQRQLVCLARALLRHTKVLILDEATAAVDMETDKLIQQTIREEFKDSTVLTIAHRLNTIMDSTRVIVMDNGKIVEFAPPQELLADNNSMLYGMAKDAGLIN